MAEDIAPIAALGARRASAALALYLRLRARPAAAPPAAPPPRPEGRLLWLHLTDPAHQAALAELCRRLRQERRRLAILVTGAEATGLPHGLITAPGPGETPAEVADFLDHWRPEAAALVGGALFPALAQEAGARGLPLALIDARVSGRRAAWRWWPGLGRAMLQRFDRILVQDEAARRHFHRLGAAPRQIELAGRMEEALGALPCTEAEREALSTALRARPVWLATALPEAEEAAVTAAHREVLGQRHRLLLILVPDQPARGPEIAARLAADGWDVALRSRDEEPSEGDQIYIADTEGELGLWYRLAPVTYMGGTLSGQGAPRHPFEAAALGSAIIHGPKVLDFAAAYASLGRARAVRLLRGAPQLAGALGELLAPDRAAEIAHNAWELTSSGANVTDRVVDYLLGLIDRPAPEPLAAPPGRDRPGVPSPPGPEGNRASRSRVAPAQLTEPARPPMQPPMQVQAAPPAAIRGAGHPGGGP